MQRRSFARRIDALDEIVAFTSAALAGTALSEGRRQAVHFTIEELFTNMVKYNAPTSPRIAPEIAIEIDCFDKGVDVTLIDTEAEPFDPTGAPDAPTGLPIGQRVPGGLGIHVLRRLVDSFGYDYSAARRESRTRFRVSAVESPAC